MADNPPPDPPRVSSKTGTGGAQKPHGYPNPRETRIPDPSTLREQWQFAIRQYSRWYSQAWGSAILAGVSFFALGWFIKGGNPLPSFSKGDSNREPSGGGGGNSTADTPSPPVPPVLSSSPADAIPTPKS